jgi:hypothetical protein
MSHVRLVSLHFLQVERLCGLSELKRGQDFAACDNARVPEPPVPPPLPRPSAPLKLALPDDKVLCERCGAEMYRMHAVWRCTQCGFKTDCCGW